MAPKKDWFSLQWQTYTELSKSELERVFSEKNRLSSSFKVFLGQLYPDFLKDFVQCEKKIRRILKRSSRRQKMKVWRDQIIGK